MIPSRQSSSRIAKTGSITVSYLANRLSSFAGDGGAVSLAFVRTGSSVTSAGGAINMARRTGDYTFA